MKQFQTREELLQDAINYYWIRPERRCVNADGYCQYKSSETSEGCAIGRLLDPEVAETLNSDAGVYDNGVWNNLPAWLKDMGQDFLHDMQRLHDSQKFALGDDVYIIDRMENHLDISKITFPE